MTQRKITVVGAGNVGGSIAQRLADRNGYEIVLVDIVDGLPQGKALDLAQAGAVCGHDSHIIGTGCYDIKCNRGRPSSLARWRKIFPLCMSNSCNYIKGKFYAI